jgi:hypothetical protein
MSVGWVPGSFVIAVELRLPNAWASGDSNKNDDGGKKGALDNRRRSCLAGPRYRGDPLA